MFHRIIPPLSQTAVGVVQESRPRVRQVLRRLPIGERSLSGAPRWTHWAALLEWSLRPVLAGPVLTGRQSLNELCDLLGGDAHRLSNMDQAIRRAFRSS